LYIFLFTLTVKKIKINLKVKKIVNQVCQIWIPGKIIKLASEELLGKVERFWN